MFQPRGRMRVKVWVKFRITIRYWVSVKDRNIIRVMVRVKSSVNFYFSV